MASLSASNRQDRNLELPGPGSSAIIIPSPPHRENPSAEGKQARGAEGNQTEVGGGGAGPGGEARRGEGGGK